MKTRTANLFKDMVTIRLTYGFHDPICLYALQIGQWHYVGTLTWFWTRRVRKMMRALRRRMYHAAMIARPWPVYYICSGMDCDGSQYSDAYRFDNGYAAYKEIAASYASADGPMGWTPCTFMEYRTHIPYHYDLALEAFENGHPHTLYPH